MKLLILPAAMLLSGCVVGTVAQTAIDVATLPVKAVSKGVDLATTSQAEADEKRGRELRKLEERCRRGRPRLADDCSGVRLR